MHCTHLLARGTRAARTLFVAALALLPAAVAAAQVPEPPREWRELRLIPGKWKDPTVEGGSGIDTRRAAYFSNVEAAGEHDYRAHGVSIAHDWIGEQRVRAKRGPAPYGQVHYPPLRRGDLVPIYSYIYEVQPFGRDSDGSSGHLRLSWVPDKKVPAGVAPGLEPLLIPLGGGNSAVNNARAKAIEAVPAKDPKAAPVLAATLEFRREFLVQSGKGSYVRSRAYTATVKEGDVLLYSGVEELGFKVRKVVPRDEKTKVIGWVELDPEPIPKADLDRAKVRYVVPTEVPEKK